MQPQKIKELILQMSLEEKAGELFQLPSYFFDNANVTGPASDLGITEDDIHMAGSCLSIIGAKKIRKLQDQHMQNHPHHIPLLFMADIINGYKTIFPIPLAQGCTFEPEFIEYCASIAAKEAAAAGIHVTFSPMADLVRDPRWGRVMESTGEDPYLNGVMAKAIVWGYQGRGNTLNEKGKIAACLKHFAGYGAPEGGRDYNNVELSERTLRNDYMPAYQDAINAGCALVMTSFNTLNRIPSSGNHWLMREVLRKEMGFDGVLISDWAAIAELLTHGIAADEEEAAHLAIKAGVDIDMVTSIYIKQLKKLVKKGTISESLLDEAVLRVLTLKNDLGLFERPYKDGSEEDEQALLLCKEHRIAARECAEKSFVLLKNEKCFLPLQKDNESFAFIGPFVDNQLLSGSWSFFGDDSDCVTIKKAIQTNYPYPNIFFAAGCPTVDPGVEVLGFQKTPLRESIDVEQALKEAVALAGNVDKVILCLGEHREYTGECASRADITLPSCQLELLRQVAEVNPNVCVVLFGGRPLDICEVDKYAKAILEAWLPGIEGGNAIAHVLFGATAPSGKLSMSFPRCVGQVPVFYNHMNTGRPFHGDYRKGRFASKYLDIPNEPLYPFGYGLTYTSFSYSKITLNKTILTTDDSITATIILTNTGNHTGTETVQLYLHDLAASVTRPVKELKGFQKITLTPGQSATVSFQITEKMLRFYDINMSFLSEPGDFELYIGSDSTTENKSTFTLR